MLLKGKSGWCSTICPLLPVQRIYGQTPFALVANAHCQPCVGCLTNCYDFNPRAAYLADPSRTATGAATGGCSSARSRPGARVLHGPRRPGHEMLGGIALYIAVSGADLRARRRSSRSPYTLTTLFGAVAFGTFYWHRRRRSCQCR